MNTTPQMIIPLEGVYWSSQTRVFELSPNRAVRITLKPARA